MTTPTTILFVMGNKNGTPVLRQEDIEILSNSSGLEETTVWRY